MKIERIRGESGHSDVMDVKRCSPMFPWARPEERSCTCDVSVADSTIGRSVISCSEYSLSIDETLDNTNEELDHIQIPDISDAVEFRNCAALSEDLANITEKSDLCDVQFLVGANKLPLFGVKAILAARSSCLHQLLVNQRIPTCNKQRIRFGKEWILTSLRKLRTRKPSQPGRISQPYLTIEVPEFEADVFRQFLTYVHTGKVELSVQNVIGLLNAADVYDTRELRTACIRFVESALHINTALRLLKSSESFGSRKVTKLVVTEILDFIAERAGEIFQLKEFETVSKKNVVQIFTHSNLNLSEAMKWDAALRWSRRHCRKRGQCALRRTMKILCRRVQFCDLPLPKLLSEVQPLGIVSDEVLEKAVLHQRQPRRVIGCESPAPSKPPRRRHRHVRHSAKDLLPLPSGKHLLQDCLQHLSSRATSTPKKVLLACEELNSSIAL